MASKKQQTGQVLATKYSDRLRKSPEQKQAEQLDIQVEDARIDFESGVQNVKSQVEKAKNNVNRVKSELVKAERALEDAKDSQNLTVQLILDKLSNVAQKKLDVQTAEEEFQQKQETLTDLIAIQSELF